MSDERYRVTRAIAGDTESPLYAIILAIAGCALFVLLVLKIASSGVSFFAIIPLVLGVAATAGIWRENRANAIALGTVIAGGGILLFVR